MLLKRIIVCLDVKDGRVVKGVRFRGLRDVGDPAALAERYEAEGADEIVFLDVSASVEGRQTTLDAVRRTAERLFVPLTVGGGITRVEDVGRLLRAGADKVSVNTAAVLRPFLLSEAADRFGSQCVVVSIDAARSPTARPSATRGAGEATRDEASAARYTVYTHGARRATGIDAVEWAARCQQLGAGEVLLTSIDRDGTRAGYDLELTGTVVRALTVPVIASGGAGRAEDLLAALRDAGADAALAAGIFHDGTTTVHHVKGILRRFGVPIRVSGPLLAAAPGG